MTNPFLAEFDSIAHPAFLDAGIADTAILRRAYAADIPCLVYIDREPATATLAGVEILKDQAMITMLRTGVVGVPKNGDQIIVGSEIFTVARRMRGDESQWVFVCQA